MDKHSRYKRHWLWCRNQNIKRRHWQTADCVQVILPATSQMTPKTPLANIYKSSGQYTRFLCSQGIAKFLIINERRALSRYFGVCAAAF